MNKRIVLFWFILISLNVASQNVVVTGVALGQQDKLVRVIVYSDQFSNLEHTIAQTRTNQLGEFTMKFWVDETQFAFLAFELEKGEFYLSPGATYNFKIHTDTSSVGSIFDRLPLSFTLEADDNGVQNAIGDFNATYNDFIYNNVASIYKSRDKSVVAKFVADMQQKYSNNTSKYVSNYVDYSIAALLWLSRKESNSKVLENYIINKPVLYNNIQYTDFFKEFFKSYFNTEKPYTYSELTMAINSNEGDALSKLLLKDTLIVSDSRVLEIVEMLILDRNYHNRDVNKRMVMAKFNRITEQSKFIENKKIANNFMDELIVMQNGSPAPVFRLVNSDMDSVSLDSFKGKYVLLSFVKEDCNICNFQMQLISDIKKDLDNKFEIITVVAGNSTHKVADFANERGYNWPILKSGDNILLFEDYNVVAYPTYIFVNPDGTIAYA
ncbi:MAG: TlpA disulfide reductase family protein, partial [Bacteroidota bacterium]